MATLSDVYDEALANIVRRGYSDYVAGDTGNRWFALATADPGDTGANEVTGLSRTAVRLNEVQTLTITGAPTGGSFTITYSGQTTAAIPFDATAAEIQAELELLSNVGEGNVLVTGGPLPGAAIAIEFVKALGGQSLSLMTTTDSLTGGTTPASAIVETVDGLDVLGAYADDAGSGGRITTLADTLPLGTATVPETATHGMLFTAEVGGNMVVSEALVGPVSYAADQAVEIGTAGLSIFGAGA